MKFDKAKICQIYDAISCWGDAMLWQLPGAHETQAVQETIRKNLLRFYLNPDGAEKGHDDPFSRQLSQTPRQSSSQCQLLTYSPFHRTYAFVWMVKGWCHINYTMRNRKILSLIDMLPTFQLSDFLCAIIGKTFHPQNKSENKWIWRQSMSLKVIVQV